MRLSSHHRRLHNDEGTSLIELLVGMAIMAVFGAMFSGAIYMMTNSSKTAQSIVTTSTQLNTAFVRLDKSVRYAAAFSVPDRSNGSWYVEFLTTNTTGPAVCTQLRVQSTSPQQLQSRTWTVVGTVASTPTIWVPLASGITNGDVIAPTADRPQPFVLNVPSGSSAKYPSLTVALVATSGDAATTSTSVTTFPAVNGTTTSSTAVCGEKGRP